MIELLLVRHGNTFEADQIPLQIGLRTDLPLTAQGKIQAATMAKHLIAQKIEPKAIYAGTLQRQSESAQIIGAPFNILLHEHYALNELDYGEWEGLTAEQIATQWPEEYKAWNEEGKWPDSIFKTDRQARLQEIEEWLKLLRKIYSAGDTIIGVTSNGLLRFFRPEKVKTGHFCELHLFQDHLEIKSWNISPSL